MKTRLRGRLKKRGWSAAEVSRYIAAVPSEVAGRPRCFSDLVHTFTQGEGWAPASSSFAAKVDDLIERLEQADEAGSPLAYLDVMRTCSWIADDAWWRFMDADARRLDGRSAQDVHWEDVNEALVAVCINIWYAQLAYLDAEFTALAAPTRQPRPLFADLLPKMPASAREDGGKLILNGRREAVRRPARQLLELTYTMLHRWGRNSWPSESPSRADLALACKVDEAAVGSIFQGKTALTAGTYNRLFEAMRRYFNRGKASPSMPALLLAVAVHWTELFIRTGAGGKLKSWILLDPKWYVEWWSRAVEELGPRASSCPGKWPAWLCDADG